MYPITNNEIKKRIIHVYMSCNLIQPIRLSDLSIDVVLYSSLLIEIEKSNMITVFLLNSKSKQAFKVISELFATQTVQEYINGIIYQE